MFTSGGALSRFGGLVVRAVVVALRQADGAAKAKVVWAVLALGAQAGCEHRLGARAGSCAFIGTVSSSRRER